MLRLPSLVLPLLALLFATTACSTHRGQPGGQRPAPVSTAYEITRDQVYTPAGWPQAQQADIYVPEGAGPFPAVLVIHGGGWESGDRLQVASIARRLAKRGFVAVNITYRLAPAYVFPAQLQDVQQAVLWMRANAARYRIAPDRIGAFGYSAGAHLAALLGGIGTGDALFVPGSSVRAVVAGGTPTDLAKWPNGRMVVQFIGGKRDDRPDQYRAASPIRYVTPGDPPVFLYYGGMDRLVPVDHSEDYRERLDAAGVINETVVLRGRGHILAFLTDGAAVDAALEFLDRYLRG